MIVELTNAERARAWSVARERLERSGRDGRDHARSVQRADGERYEHDYVGCLAELAVARAFGVPWAGDVDTFHRVPDVGPWDVRSTDRGEGRLILRDDDPVDRAFVLAVVIRPAVRGERVRVRICGWLYAREGRRDEWLRNPGGRRPSWFVPQRHLRPIETLPGIVTRSAG